VTSYSVDKRVWRIPYGQFCVQRAPTAAPFHIIGIFIVVLIRASVGGGLLSDPKEGGNELRSQRKVRPLSIYGYGSHYETNN
jgi:hypothetical protein